MSFIILTFNQVAYIEEAVEGALAQQYGNLEIIVSDDGSTDGTWELLQRLAERHRQLRINQSSENLGTLGNLYAATRLANGVFYVMAAGDDVSYPHRVSTCVAKWLDEQAFVIQSSYDIINEQSIVIQSAYIFDTSKHEFQSYFEFRPFIIHGASSCYDARVFKLIKEPNRKIYYEDSFFTLFLNFLFLKHCFIDQPLVCYRRNYNSITNNNMLISVQEIKEREEKTQLVVGSIAILLSVFRDAVVLKLGYSNFIGKTAAVNISALDRDIAFYQYRGSWTTRTKLEKIRMILTVRRKRHAAWLLARLFGAQSVSWLRRLRLRTGRSI